MVASRPEWRTAWVWTCLTLALLLAGPALSLPNMLVLIKVMGVRKTLAFCAIIVAVATITGLLYGRIG